MFIREGVTQAVRTEPADEAKSRFQTFLMNRESCTGSRKTTRGQTKTPRRNVPSACRYWRKGRTSGEWAPVSWVPVAPMVSSACCWGGAGLAAPLSHRLSRCVSFKTQRCSNQQKTPECLKITSLVELPFGTGSGFLRGRLFRPLSA